jgi:RNA polymerase sigma factor (sigma-70 family)
MDPRTDQQLWQQFQEGEEEVFPILFLRYYPLLFRYGLSLSQDSELAEECIQDLFCYLYEKHTQLTSVNHIKGYLFASFRRRVLRAIKDEGRYQPVENMVEATIRIQPTEEEKIVDREESGLRRHKLSELLDSLPSRQREVIFLKYFDGLDTEEITQVMGISHQGVLNVLHKAHKNMRKLTRHSGAAGPTWIFCCAALSRFFW